MSRKLLPQVLFLFFALAGTAQGQVTQEDRDALERTRSRMDEFVNAETEEDLAWREAIGERLRLLEALIGASDALENLPTEAALAERARSAREQLNRLSQTSLPETLGLVKAEELLPYEQDSIAAEAERVQAQSALDEFVARAADWETELSELPERARSIREREAEIIGESERAAFRRTSAEYEQRVVSERTKFLTEALKIRSVVGPVLELELELATAKATRAKDLFDIADAEATELREAASEAARKKAETEARRAELERDPLERFRLNIRSETSALKAETADHQTQLNEIEQWLQREEESRDHMETQRENLIERLRLQPQSDEVLLDRNLKRTERARKLLDEVALPLLYAEMERNQTRLAEVLDRRWELSLPDGENDALQALVQEVGPEREEETQPAFAAILREEGLIRELKTRENQLAATDRVYGQLAEVMTERDELLDEFEDFVRGRMMWSRTDAPITANTFARALRELSRITVPYRKGETWSVARSRLVERWPFVFLMIVVVAALDFVRRRLRTWRTSSTGRQGWPARAVHAVGSLVWAGLPALQIWILAWTIREVGGLHGFDPPLAVFLAYQAGFVLMRRLFIVLIGREGLCVGPHGVVPEVGLQVVRAVRTITVAGQALYAPSRVLTGPPFEFENFPRFLYTLWILSAGVACLSLLRGKGAIVQNWTPPGTISRGFAGALVYVAGLALLPIVGLDALGYRVGAERALTNGLRLLVGLFVLVGLFRFLQGLGERLADWSVRRAKDEQEAEQRDLRANALRVISRLSAVLVVVLAAVFLQQLWAIGDPTEKLFSAVELFQTAPETQNAEGATIPAEFITLWDVMVAVLIVVAGHLIAHNLKRIHDLLIAPVAGAGDVGSRYAAFALLRYALLAVAYVGAMLNVGFSFETIGWFATAASVGLGFGLQEIVANFISGLILLFERPIRVGDIVTIGTTSGTVDEISMRATVVTNWERQTMIIPNKKFVTENLTNWTRNDRVMRRDLLVRVAYGTDVEQVVRLLDQIVSSHPKVLEDPLHRIWFQEFGPFGIEFKVWFFTHIEDGLAARSEIHSAITHRFASEGIEIPVVQRDVQTASPGAQVKSPVDEKSLRP